MRRILLILLAVLLMVIAFLADRASFHQMRASYAGPPVLPPDEVLWHKHWAHIWSIVSMCVCGGAYALIAWSFKKGARGSEPLATWAFGVCSILYIALFLFLMAYAQRWPISAALRVIPIEAYCMISLGVLCRIALSYLPSHNSIYRAMFLTMLFIATGSMAASFIHLSAQSLPIMFFLSQWKG
jgi:hypothetical protein